ncbi:MAG: hypothetical protein ACXVEI_04045 [Actinomycetota bacterium]
MSTQYGTLSHHKTVQVPMWLIVALVVGMLAIAVGYTVEQYQGQGAVATSAVTTIPDTQVAAREGGAVFPATVSTPVFRGGLETSGVMRAAAVGASDVGASFPDTMVGAREGTSPQTTNGREPIVVNGQICHQCL